ncbi:MAG: hypothetical protein LAN84_04105 [Acidobacteriia bacterium]|nr:hypothetical protein [Terriglobia bacterium]
MKSRKHHSTSSAAQSKPGRGRPPKAEQKRVLQEDGWFIAREFSSHPLRSPVDVRFRPFYERILKGDLQAIEDYLDENVDRSNLDTSFYELVGRLTEIRRFAVVADQILKDFERRDLLPSDRDVYRHWYRALKPLCLQARQFIRVARASCPTVSRGKLWRDYVLQPLPTVRYIRFAGNADEERLQDEENKRHKELRRLAGVELLAWSESQTIDSIRSQLEALGCHGRELNILTQSRFHQGQVDRFRPFNLVPREIFLDLAKTTPGPLTPAFVARHYACRIARISEGTASHKAVGKTTD